MDTKDLQPMKTPTDQVTAMDLTHVKSKVVESFQPKKQ